MLLMPAKKPMKTLKSKPSSDSAIEDRIPTITASIEAPRMKLDKTLLMSLNVSQKAALIEEGTSRQTKRLAKPKNSSLS